MAQSLSGHVLTEITGAETLYHRLVIVAGPPGSGKSFALRELQRLRGWPRVNLNFTLSEKLLELNVKQRALRVGRLVEDIVGEHAGDVLLLDNLELLFHPDLSQDPLRLLQSLSRNRTIVAAWRGEYIGTSLTYAAPGHPEYRRYEEPQVGIVSSQDGLDAEAGPSTQENLA